jgi:carbon monoxide dehydrogenase subunit G
MRLENSFDVPAPPERAWELLNDVPRVIPCMPGAELTDTVDDTHWKAIVHVKLGPIALQFGTEIERTAADASTQRAVLAAKARELKGRGGAQATIESTLEPAASGTRVTLVTDLTLQGPVAQYGRGIVADVARTLVGRFADCIASQLQQASPTAAPAVPAVKPVGGVRLAFAALWRRLMELFRKA